MFKKGNKNVHISILKERLNVTKENKIEGKRGKNRKCADGYSIPG
jgi:hypothetical protein